MAQLTITLNAFQLLLLAIAAFGAGFFIRTKQLRKKQSRILDLENEMIADHAEILKLQQQLSQIRKPEKGDNVPVVPFKQDQGSDIGTLKKKLL